MVDKPDTAATNAASNSAAALTTSEPANLPAATTITPAGAPVQIVPDVDMSHPAVDANPRERTTALQNRIDFNDPTLAPTVAVEQQLEAQAKA